MQERMRTFQMTAPTSNKRIDSDFYVEGYATTFEPYVLYDGDEPIYEQISRNAFANADMSDIILQFDHEGKVYARTSNGTLIVDIDDKGLFIAADLSKTPKARDLYTDISAGMITQMSWRWINSPDDEDIDYDTRTIHVNRVKRVLDVSAVSIPANNQTSISARKKQFDDHVEEIARREKQEAQEKKRKLMKLKLKLESES